MVSWVSKDSWWGAEIRESGPFNDDEQVTVTLVIAIEGWKSGIGTLGRSFIIPKHELGYYIPSQNSS